MKIFNDKEERKKFLIGLTILLVASTATGFWYYFNSRAAQPQPEALPANPSDSTFAALLILAISGIVWAVKEFWPGLLFGIFVVLIYYWIIKPWIKEAMQDAMRELLDDYLFREDFKELIQEALKKEKTYNPY